MKKSDQHLLWLGIIIIIALMVWTLARFMDSMQPSPTAQRPQSTTSNDEVASVTPERTFPTITVHNLFTAMQDKTNPVVLYDTRPMASYDANHIPGSLTSETFNTMRTGRRIILITDDGAETDTVRALSHTIAPDNTITLLDGGIAAWQAAGRPLVSITTQPDFLTSAKVQFIEPRDLQAILAAPTGQPIVIVDTRRPGNFANGHIAGAINIPITELEFRYREIPAGAHIIIYGATDLSSFQSGALLYDVNIFTAKTIRGGWEAWEKYGYPIVTE